MDYIEPPASLSELKKIPRRLYFKGNLELLNRPKVAIIGSRKCLSYTQNAVLSLASTLKNHGVCVVSGAAIGCDIYAHSGAFPSTIAVFGNGLERIYPAQNAKMIEKIYRDGLALSEYEPEFRPTSWSFLERNRIIIALSDAVVVAQADLNSGSASSARLAISMKKPLFTLPQRLDESRATNELIKSGAAKLITDFAEFAREFGSPTQEQGDELLEFVRGCADFDKCYAKFGDLLYEYELDCKIAIDGVFVRVL